MDTMQFYVIEIGLFSEFRNFWYLVVQLNNFAPMSNCPWVQDKSYKPPPPPEVCVGGGGQIVLHDFTSIFSFINIHEYANEIILYMTIV